MSPWETVAVDASWMLAGFRAFFSLAVSPLLSVTRLICDAIAQASQEYGFMATVMNAGVPAAGICPVNQLRAPRSNVWKLNSNYHAVKSLITSAAGAALPRRSPRPLNAPRSGEGMRMGAEPERAKPCGPWRPPAWERCSGPV